jgi:hypothetical protein
MRMRDAADLTLVSEREAFTFRPNTIYVPFGAHPGDLVADRRELIAPRLSAALILRRLRPPRGLRPPRRPGCTARRASSGTFEGMTVSGFVTPTVEERNLPVDRWLVLQAELLRDAVGRE